MQKLLILKGLPASGKSTWAKQQLKENPGKYKRISKDDLREMFDGGKWSGENENFILKVRDQLILESLRHGHDVIVDDTNLNSKHETHIRELVKDFPDVEVSIVEFRTSVADCIKLDSERANSVGIEVIRKMYTQYLRKNPEKYLYTENIGDAIICDIDGTLADLNGRNPHTPEKCGEDLVNRGVSEIIAKCMDGRTIILVSGREELYRQQTEDWLYNNRIDYDTLYMRQSGDRRKDDVVKKEIYENQIRGKYNILFVLDDRPRVCRMWYQLGLTVLKIGDPDAEF